jgi:hypothetical protein
VGEQGRVSASIDAQGEIRGGGIRGSDLAIGTAPGGALFSVDSFAVPHGHVITRMELVSPETGSSVFSVWTSASGADTHLSLGDPANVVRMTLAGIEVRGR